MMAELRSTYITCKKAMENEPEQISQIKEKESSRCKNCYLFISNNLSKIVTKLCRQTGEQTLKEMERLISEKAFHGLLDQSDKAKSY